MADNYLITGYWGEPHVTAENDRGINAAMFGTGRFVLPVGEQFNAEYIGNNTIRLYDGKLMNNGAAAGIPAGEYVDLLISNAGQGMRRNDLVVFQYSKDPSTLKESGTFIVVEGIAVSGTPADPALTQRDILSGKANLDQMALWRVPVSGATISAPVKLFNVYQNNASHAANKNNPHGVTAAQLGAASEGDHRIKTYSSLNHIGLTDANDMSATDATANFIKIFSALGGVGVLACAVNYTTNFAKSIFAKLTADLGDTMECWLDVQCCRTSDVNLQIDVVPQFYSASNPRPTNRYSCVLRYIPNGTSYLSPFVLTRSKEGFFSRAGDTIPGAVFGMLNGMVKLGAYTNMLQLSSYNTPGEAALGSHLQLMNGNGSSLLTLVSYDKDGKRADYPVLHSGSIGGYNIGRIVAGSYVGTGGKGSGNKNSLSLPFAPKLVIVGGDGIQPTIFIAGITKPLTWGSVLVNGASVTVFWKNTGVEWWLENPVTSWMPTESWENRTVDDCSASEQLNDSGKTYNYIAIG